MKDKTSWGGVADWYDSVVTGENSYQAKVILPNLMRLLDPKKGEKVLDIACGQGFFSHALASAGASMTGVDIAPELIDIANKKASKGELFYESASDDLSRFDDGEFDAGLCVLAIQNIERMTDTFWEISKKLKKGGAFILVINHPAFRIPGKSFWETDAKGIMYRRVDEYISESRKEMDMHPGNAKAAKEVTISFHRPIQAYSKSLAKAGFAIKRIEEWMSHKESEEGPRKAAEDRARREFPLFMCLECVKL